MIAIARGDGLGFGQGLFELVQIDPHGLDPLRRRRDGHQIGVAHQGGEILFQRVGGQRIAGDPVVEGRPATPGHQPVEDQGKGENGNDDPHQGEQRLTASGRKRHLHDHRISPQEGLPGDDNHTWWPIDTLCSCCNRMRIKTLQS
jgi:hypothetical protein